MWEGGEGAEMGGLGQTLLAANHALSPFTVSATHKF